MRGQSARNRGEQELTERGVDGSDLIDGIEPIARADVPKLLAAYDQVWHW